MRGNAAAALLPHLVLLGAEPAQVAQLEVAPQVAQVVREVGPRHKVQQVGLRHHLRPRICSVGFDVLGLNRFAHPSQQPKAASANTCTASDVVASPAGSVLTHEVLCRIPQRGNRAGPLHNRNGEPVLHATAQQQGSSSISAPYPPAAHAALLHVHTADNYRAMCQKRQAKRDAKVNIYYERQEAHCWCM